MIPDPAKVLPLFVEKRVQFIVIGGVAASFHGSPRSTLDLDVVYARNRENLKRLVEALQPYSPYLRGAPPGLPFRWDENTLRNGLNFTLTTTLGDIDLLGEVTGGGTYEDLLADSEEMTCGGAKFRCVTLAKLITLKNAAGRTKDLQVLAELKAILEESRRKKPTDKS
jgi:predicted nucleotidyltransferase